MKTWTCVGGALMLAALVSPEPVRLPERLADTGLYAAGTYDAVAPQNRPFSPQYPLWTDGLSKRRWVYLPPGTAIDGADEHGWRFPVGTKFWKEFRLGDRKVETRLLWKVADDGWEFATYAWNEAGTEAVLAPAGGLPRVIEVAPGRRHSIPSRADCAACHGTVDAGPLGFTALQLSPDRDPHAIHGEPLQEGMLTLAQLSAEGLLAHSRLDLASKPPRIRTASPLTRSVLGYMAANCAMCHNGKGEIAAMAPVITQRALVEDGDAVAAAMLGRATRWQQPGIPDGHSVVIAPGSPEASVLLARMRSRAPSSQMPPLGSVVRDERAVDAVTRWIAGGLRDH
ncbi:MAG TPA: hypothetical protein VM364_09565 [Vicinamibacterales bacterium]|nr:hypothetical protein [Vicinamibacterales bacterium]